jgi:hypothetical protein
VSEEYSPILMSTVQSPNHKKTIKIVITLIFFFFFYYPTKLWHVKRLFGNIFKNLCYQYKNNNNNNKSGAFQMLKIIFEYQLFK